ncbi:cysteine--tRNA ligase [Convivina praedatoris]|uniref:Cysteine--tRNA ligase n=1 Tax=Convivina praedatoris TaxID=2880963 RepID=A0ABN8HA51_9LACO|nr:cysteine--tRNA ligase [Convivina sp. LMG 32447]CAH1855331.1 Cysteine--tRNA ligase [Convivina sp. LMG 32447]CAH1855991.1 Cysteine--tRNA ligase [Convivina sp. LMG 32447]CAH1856384.1 Cysteine--tRNA ligase [Convivina sp. LMG 32447]
MLKVYNTYTLTKETFNPITPGHIKMYVCGPTVYNYIHLGNARSASAFDTIRRYLTYRGYQVDYVSNFTDLGDKVIQQAQKEGLTEAQLAQKYEMAFDQDTAKLNIIPATVRSKATEVMTEIIDFVTDLLEKGYAYEVEGDVYFRARKFSNYGILSHQNLNEMEENAAGRLNAQEALRKEDPIDFALWKGEHRSGVQAWSSPWGFGRPGWHIECSVMIDKYLGPAIDLHGGGIDLAFPHHTNEIAQSETHSGEEFVRYWLHNGFVNVNQEKMSKSLGNFTTVHELLSQYSDAQTLRFLLTKTHYRRPINYSDTTLEQAQIELDRIRRAYRRLAKRVAVESIKDSTDAAVEEQLKLIKADFMDAMDDDFNTENGLAVIFELVTLINQYADQNSLQLATAHHLLDALQTLTSIFGIDNLELKESLNEEEQQLLDARAQARLMKDFTASDRLRDELLAKGVVVRDTVQGQEWERK